MGEEPREAPRARGTYAKGVARRREILDSAIEVFAQRGADRTSLRAIAQEVGVTHAALIHHFGTLEALLVEVYRESAQRLEGEQPASDDVSPVELMRLSAERNRDVPGMVQLYTTLVASALEEGHPAARAFATERFADVRRRLAEQIRARQADGRLRPDLDADQVAALVIAASDGLQTQWLLEPSVDQVGALALLDRLLGEAPAG
ncbi:TetR/AcrR family transcriptional regulator [Amnibacterium sp. CER49]|uniref:TetR/AcrR family transcriptional regulator n=1 Tax=Amnibacterium sp. CER49 TaxID=3039161 RepID=UPI002448C1F8|nr:TetR/AcrR family transcriptional regulator [Amnibacterium sp. CER49]MDH2444816.1 TetR/AcrR family transcriptional regulator [Amnibacterium sp. CER49]